MTSNNRKFLIFKLRDSLYALDLKQVAEIFDLPLISPIPLAPTYYSGALNFHGNIVAVMNLALFLGFPGGNHPEKIIVLHQEIASLAFLVDTVVSIISEEEVSIGPATDNTLAVAYLTIANGEATQLDLEALVLAAETGIQSGS